MTKRRLTFKVPNRLITDDRLSYSARKLGAVLYSRRNAFGNCSKTLATLSRLSGLSVSTVSKALVELQDTKYITVQRNYRYHTTMEKLLFDKSTYSCTLSFDGGYTLMPRDIFKHTGISNSSFTILMYLYQQTGNKNRAYPSISRMVKALGMAHSTVCCGLQMIRELACILVHRCVKRNHAYASNTYYIVLECDRDTIPFSAAIRFLPCTEPYISGLTSLVPCLNYSPPQRETQDTLAC